MQCLCLQQQQCHCYSGYSSAFYSTSRHQSKLDTTGSVNTTAGAKKGRTNGTVLSHDAWQAADCELPALKATECATAGRVAYGYLGLRVSSCQKINAAC